MHQGGPPLSQPSPAAAKTRVLPPASDYPAEEVALAAVEATMASLLAPGVPGSVLPAMATACLGAGGKRMRARLALQAAVALGVPVQAAIPWAAACELMHNATLVHDDLQDGDTVRRGQPTTWVTYGSAQAINTGDWLFMRAFAALQALAAPQREAAGFALAQALATGLAQVIEGQGLECASADYFSCVDDFPYEAMVRGKTAALFALPVRGAALLAGHGPAQADALAAPFAELGILFQQQDDVLDLWGDKGRGLCGSDLYEGKLSAVVVTHLRRVPADAAWLLPLLQAPREATDAAGVRRAIEAFVAAGSRDALLAQMVAGGARARADVAPALRAVFESFVERVWAPIWALRPHERGQTPPEEPDPQ